MRAWGEKIQSNNEEIKRGRDRVKIITELKRIRKLLEKNKGRNDGGRGGGW